MMQVNSNFVVSGLVIPASSADLDIAIPLGVAIIDGRRVNIPGSTTVTAADTDTNYVFLKLNKNASNQVTSAEFEVNVSGTFPTSAVKIAELVAAGGAITSTVDSRQIGPRQKFKQFVIFDSGSGNFTIPAYATHGFDANEVIVEIMGSGAGGGGGMYSTGGTEDCGGGGGGAGGYLMVQKNVTPGGTIAYVVGALGAGGAGGIFTSTTVPAAGSNGANSTATINAVVYTGTAGALGAAGVSNYGTVLPIGGAGGLAVWVAPDIKAFPGGGGEPGQKWEAGTLYLGGKGGTSRFGDSPNSTAVADAVDSTGYGVGGTGGGGINGGGDGYAGGDGGAGAVIIWY